MGIARKRRVLQEGEAQLLSFSKKVENKTRKRRLSFVVKDLIFNF